jgi:FOG: CBS domain
MKPSKNLFTVSLESTLLDTLEIIKDKKLSAIPVVEGKKFCGAISKEQIYDFYYENDEKIKADLDNTKVKEILINDIPTIEPMENIEKAAGNFAEKHVPFIAVVDAEGIFKGIVTHLAIYEEFKDIFGFDKGEKITIISHDIPGQISKLSRTIVENDGDIISFVVLDPKSVTHIREIDIRVKSKNIDLLIKKIKDAGFSVR